MGVLALGCGTVRWCCRGGSGVLRLGSTERGGVVLAVGTVGVLRMGNNTRRSYCEGVLGVLRERGMVLGAGTAMAWYCEGGVVLRPGTVGVY